MRRGWDAQRSGERASAYRGGASPRRGAWRKCSLRVKRVAQRRSGRRWSRYDLRRGTRDVHTTDGGVPSPMPAPLTTTERGRAVSNARDAAQHGRGRAAPSASNSEEARVALKRAPISNQVMPETLVEIKQKDEVRERARRRCKRNQGTGDRKFVVTTPSSLGARVFSAP